MPSAQYLANQMLDALNAHTPLLSGLLKGAASLPVDFYYLGKDFLDTEHSSENYDDKFRFAEMIKAGTVNRESLQKIARIFYDRFESRVTAQSVGSAVLHATGSMIGRFSASQLVGLNLGMIFSSRMVAGFIGGTIAGGILSTGAAVSRAIYASRDLRQSAPDVYNRLRAMGNLDLLYFILEDRVKPFDEAYRLALTDPRAFQEVCNLFYEKA